MAKENVKKFFEEVSKSEELQEKLKAVISGLECEIAKNIKVQTEAIVSFANNAGFDFGRACTANGGVCAVLGTYW